MDPYINEMAKVFTECKTAAEFLSDDGEGGFVLPIWRMADEIDRLRSALAECQRRAPKRVEIVK
jgi:hypothetical protein